MTVLNLIRPELLNQKPYVTRSTPIKHRLHANELPWSALDMDIPLNYYPDKCLKDQLQEQLADRYKVNKEQIALTRGSDDGIDLTTRLFLRAGKDACMQFPPTFAMYSFYALLQHAAIIECPLDPLCQFQISLEDIRNRWQTNCKIIFLCNPNNPTANLFDLDFIASLCNEYRDRSVIIVDEAYIEFTEAQSATCLIPEFDNLVVLRTLSKAYGLANLRLGVLMAQERVIQAFNAIMSPFPLSSVVLDLAQQTLEKSEWFLESINRIKEARSQLIKELQLCPLIENVYPTETNFILVKTKDSMGLVSWLARQDIEVKSFPPDSSLQHHLRITVGDELQNEILLNALSSFQNNYLGN